MGPACCVTILHDNRLRGMFRLLWTRPEIAGASPEAHGGGVGRTIEIRGTYPRVPYRLSGKQCTVFICGPTAAIGPQTLGRLGGCKRCGTALAKKKYCAGVLRSVYSLHCCEPKGNPGSNRWWASARGDRIGYFEVV